MPTKALSPVEHAAILEKAATEVMSRRPSRTKLRVSIIGKLKPREEEQRDCCRDIHWSVPGIGVRHLCSVRHIAALYGLTHQELLNAVWEREAEHMHAEG